MARLPVPGSDIGTWGDVLNEFLLVSLNDDGTLKTVGLDKGGTGGTSAIEARTNLDIFSKTETTDQITTAVTAHTSDTSAAHAASAISFTPTGTIAATDVQAAIAEVASEATSDHGNLTGLGDDDHTQYVLTSGNRTTTGINLTSAAATTDSLTFRVAGDTNARFVINADGTQEWGSGTVSPDTNLYRTAANELKTDDYFSAVEGVAARIGTVNEVQLGRTGAGVVGAGITFGNAGDTNLYRSTANSLKTDDEFRSASIISAYDAGSDMVVLGRTASGVQGPGITFGNLQDTNLYRSAANTLKTDDNFEVGGTLTLSGSPSAALHAATKQYVDATASGISPKSPVKAATTANITLSGTQTIDGVALIAGDRVLVKNQSTASENGIYDVAAGAWARSTDADTSGEVTTGMYAAVQSGTTNGGTSWILQTPGPITLDTTALTFVLFSSQLSHSSLQGLGADDHPQYLLKAGGTMAGALTLAADPAAALHAATKQYVDSVASGQDPKMSVRAATTANITLSGAQTIDGVSVIAGDRVLVKNQSTGSQNGIYVAAAGAWARSSDADAATELNTGMFTYIEEGTTNGGVAYVLTTPAPITLGTTNLTFARFSSPNDHSLLSNLNADNHTQYLLTSGERTTTGVTLTGAATGTDNLVLKVSGDSNARFIANAGGSLEWGSGSGAVDTNLYRATADTLKTDDALTVVGNLALGGDGSFGGGAGSVAFIKDATTPPSSNPTGGGVLYSEGGILKWRRPDGTIDTMDDPSGVIDPDGSYAAVGTDVLKARVTGNANPRFTLNADGSIEWGDGTATPDTNLYRTSANHLKTDDQFSSAVNILAQASGVAQVIVGQAGPGNEAGVILGQAGDANLYRSSANNLKTDDSLEVAGTITMSGTPTADTHVATKSYTDAAKQDALIYSFVFGG